VSAGPSVDEELQKKVDDERASLEGSKKALGLMPESGHNVVVGADHAALVMSRIGWCRPAHLRW
jgi:hypothetical protein